MNSYSENLHSSVLASLESQEMNQKKLDSQLNSSMFTLYYAEGAEIVTDNKLELATKKYNQAQTVKEQAVKTKNISTNIVMSATQQNTNTLQSVSNGAVSAANIQIATNAIVRLASDMGSIFSIINASDYGTQIYQQSIEAYNLMNRTAYLAEVASQHAMEASAAIAEVSSSTVQDKAKATDASISNLLQVSSTNFTTTAAIVAADNDAKAAASVNTKAAQGIIESNKVELEAAKVAYLLNNKSLNYNLRVNVPKIYNNSYEVSFNYFKAPFKTDEKGTNTPPLGLDNPVKTYNLFLVKDSKKSVFSASAAEELLINPLQRIQIIPPANLIPLADLTPPANSIPLTDLIPPAGTPAKTNLLTSETILSNYKTRFQAINNLRASQQKAIEAKDNLSKANVALALATKEKSDADNAVNNTKNNITRLTKELDTAKQNTAKAAEAAKKNPDDKDLAKTSAQAARDQDTIEKSLNIAKLTETKATDFVKVAADNLKIANTNAANAKNEVSEAETLVTNDKKDLETAETAFKEKKDVFKTINILDLVDTDNEVIVLGEKYVIFLLIVFTDEYKKGINTYDDYLSAPSETFSLKKTLNAVKDINIVQKSERKDNTNAVLPALSPYAVNFTVNKDDKLITEYRCMFLPYKENDFTKNDLDNFEESIQETILKKEIETVENEITQYETELKSVKDKNKELKDQLDKQLDKNQESVDLSDKQKLNDEIGKTKSQVNSYSLIEIETNSKLEIAQTRLNHLYIGLEKMYSQKTAQIKNTKAFFFNQKLAENVPSGNYTVAAAVSNNPLTYEVKIDPATTDNFGNSLIDSKLYIPVILSYYNGSETNRKQYNNNLSDWENEESFTFSIVNNQQILIN
ncbi:synaptonemal complex protein 1 [Flavobacterium chungangense]|uniref:Uncharacterized protein n=1 Tax=Flavobacterium chungangense TaxID=554283 RepID=A0A6V6Z7A4_9FLAO|nr:hypothetical protein [Flavobacterium chungangense]CAD0007535.1 hypothetical protein FLACHUCJ7_03364 [Flavobacterium chungangense]